ncbi:MAG: hypothetical protein J7L15_02435 [Clostridiales bacterium]|nr:hypothetical protein [Clostridiales bacterium]
MKFNEYLTEEFDQSVYLKDALEWLNKKFPEKGYTFKHLPKMVNDTKTYNVSINGKEFDIVGRLMDSNSDGTKDTVLFRIDAVESESEPKEEEGF